MGTSLADLQSPSAISSLLAQLTGGNQPNVPLAPPQASPLPPSAPMPAAQPSLLRRVLNNLQSLPSTIGNHLGPGTPADIQAAVAAGLLTPEQAQAARPGFLESLAMGYVQPGYAHAKYESNAGLVDAKGAPLGILGVQQLAQQVAQQRAMQKIQADIAQKFPITPGMSQDQQDQAIRGMIAYGMANGLPVDKLADAFKGLFTPKEAKTYEPKLFLNEKTGEQRWIAPAEGRSIPDGFKEVQSGGGGGMVYKLAKPTAEGSSFQYIPYNQPIPAGAVPYSTNNIQISEAGRENRFNTTQNRLAYDDFVKNKDVQTLSNRALVLDKAINTISAARSTTNPAQRQLLLGPVLSQYIQAADQDKNLRQGLLQFYEDHMYASIYGRFDKFLEKAKNGDLPPALVDAMLQHLQQMREQTRQQWLNRRDDFLGTHPGLDPDRLPKEGSIFGAPVSGTPTTGSDLYSKYGLKPPTP